MKRPKIVHLMYGDKFTRPFIPWMDAQFSNEVDQVFICMDEQEPKAMRLNLPKGGLRIFLQLPLHKKLVWNGLTLFLQCLRADKIVWHGNPILFFWALFPFLLNKCHWIIYGGMDMYLDSSSPDSFQNRMKKFVLKRVKGHITHIQGDSDWCNSFYGSKAHFFDNPIYLSNVVKPGLMLKSWDRAQIKTGILVGNSFDPSNNHLEVFDWLVSLKGKIRVICPLSYGSDFAYKKRVMEVGAQLFEADFLPLEQFMPLDDYRKLLANEVHAVVFNHKRQEAMGITLQLLALQKPVYVFPETTAFSSLRAKGIQVFSNQLIKENPKQLLEQLPAIDQTELLNTYYSEESLIKAWRNFHAA